MKIDFKKLILNLAIPLAVGGLSALITKNSMEMFSQIEKPPLSPPGWLFPVVWTILYVLMGVSAYIVQKTNGSKTKKDSAIAVYTLQLIFNFFWSIIFFNLKAYLFAFLWLLVLWILVLWNVISFYKINKTAGLLMLPYLFWVTFAGYLNFGIFLLNK